MHPNPAFRTTSAADNLAFARQRGFGILSMNGPDGPLAAHVPFVVDADGGTLTLHLARSNPIARAVPPEPSASPALAVLIVSGPDAYVSPDWYGADDQVPTWNYVAVHIRGGLRQMADVELGPHLDDLSARFEADLLPKKPWTTGKMSEGILPRMMRAILPCRLDITSIDGTWKLSQNKPLSQRAGAAAGLAARPDSGSQAIASMISTDGD